MKNIVERLKRPQPIILDGAIGTELERRGVDTTTEAWSALAVEHAPNVLLQIHQEYVEAGAEIITANTFRTQERALAKVGLGERAKSFTQRALQIARKAVEITEQDVFVAGSVAPLEDCYSPELVPGDESLRTEHEQMAAHLQQAGVDLILVETMGTVREAEAATQAAHGTGLPFAVSFICRNDGRLLSGESLKEAVRAVESFGPVFLSINCTPSHSLSTALQELRRHSESALGAYGNSGHTEDFSGWEHEAEINAITYARLAHEWHQLGVRVVGGCCGTTPDHIAEVAKSIRILETS